MRLASFVLLRISRDLQLRIARFESFVTLTIRLKLPNVYRSAKFDAKIFNFFTRLFISFYFRSEKFRTWVIGKIKHTSERKI